MEWDGVLVTECPIELIMTVKIEVALIDCKGYSEEFSFNLINGDLSRNVTYRDDGFGASSIDYAKIDGYSISGDMWRFFERKLGQEELLKKIEAECGDSQAVIENFEPLFIKTSTDSDALDAWNAYVQTSEVAEKFALNRSPTHCLLN